MQPMPAGLPDVCRRFRVRRLDLFGSAADGRFDPARSDIDLLVSFEDRAGQDYAKRYFGLWEELTELYGRPVDLVIEESVENPYLRRQIERQRKRLYEAA